MIVFPIYRNRVRSTLIVERYHVGMRSMIRRMQRNATVGKVGRVWQNGSYIEVSLSILPSIILSYHCHLSKNCYERDRHSVYSIEVSHLRPCWRIFTVPRSTHFLESNPLPNIDHREASDGGWCMEGSIHMEYYVLFLFPVVWIIEIYNWGEYSTTQQWEYLGFDDARCIEIWYYVVRLALREYWPHRCSHVSQRTTAAPSILSFLFSFFTSHIQGSSQFPIFDNMTLSTGPYGNKTRSI